MKTKKEIRGIRTDALKKDYGVYCVVGKRNGAPYRTFKQWARWVWKSHQQDKHSVFFGMSFSSYVNIENPPTCEYLTW